MVFFITPATYDKIMIGSLTCNSIVSILAAFLIKEIFYVVLERMVMAKM